MMTVTITVPEDGNVCVRTQTAAPIAAVGDLLDRAIEALTAERAALAQCPYHKKNAQ